MNNMNTKANKFFTTRQMVLIALITAITCILAPLSIPLPISPVPISFTNLVLYISVFILSWKQATVSYVIYMLLGLVGLPVFSGFSGGFGKLAGPTGGYLIGFIFLTVISGLFVEKALGRFRYLFYALGMILGTGITYFFGTLWLCAQMNLTFIQGLGVGVIPYLIGDAAKIVIALILGPVLRKRLYNIN